MNEHQTFINKRELSMSRYGPYQISRSGDLPKARHKYFLCLKPSPSIAIKIYHHPEMCDHFGMFSIKSYKLPWGLRSCDILVTSPYPQHPTIAKSQRSIEAGSEATTES